MVRIAILETDVPLPEIAAKYGTYGDMFTALLRKGGLDESAVITKHVVTENAAALPGLEEEKPDVILITGSRYDAFEDKDWINALSDYTARAIACQVKAIGERHWSVYGVT